VDFGRKNSRGGTRISLCFRAAPGAGHLQDDDDEDEGDDHDGGPPGDGDGGAGDPSVFHGHGPWTDGGYSQSCSSGYNHDAHLPGGPHPRRPRQQRLQHFLVQEDLSPVLSFPFSDAAPEEHRGGVADLLGEGRESRAEFYDISEFCRGVDTQTMDVILPSASATIICSSAGQVMTVAMAQMMNEWAAAFGHLHKANSVATIVIDLPSHDGHEALPADFLMGDLRGEERGSEARSVLRVGVRQYLVRCFL